MRALEEMDWDVAVVRQTSSGLQLQPSRATLEVYPDRVRMLGGRPDQVTYFAPTGSSANMLSSYGGRLGYTVLAVPGEEDQQGK